MAGQGLDRIPLRVPEQWNAAWFERFVREVLALADARNAIEGPGIQITGTSSEQAKISSSEDLTQFLTQPFVVAGESPLVNSRVIEGDGEAITVEDGGPGANIRVALGYALTLDRLTQVDVLSVLGTPVNAALGQGTLQPIKSAANDTVLRRKDNALSFGEVPDGALSLNVAFYDDDVAGFESGTFLDGRIAESNVTQHQEALEIGFGQLTGVPQIPGGLEEYADDAAAASGGIEVNGLYRTGSVVKVRVA